jgi:hypothetical protein
MNRTKAIVALAAILIPAATISTPALADDSKSFPGSMCRGINPTSDAQLSRGYLSIRNTSSSAYAYVYCPIVKGSPGDDNPSGVGPYSFVYATKGDSQTLACGMTASELDGNSFVYQGGTTLGTEAGTGKRTIYIPRIAKRDIYSIFCAVPPNSSINGYLYAK